jgi:enoyl-CoA hydratase/carnithine racemase
MGAEEALAVGLVNELFDGPEALMQRAHALAAQIATQAPLTMRAARRSCAACASGRPASTTKT